MNPPSFSSLFDPEAIDRSLETSLSAAAAEVETVLAKDRCDAGDLPVLISPAASAFLEPMAQKSGAITLRRFGRIVQLYIPLYLSSECESECLYCGFRKDREIDRRTLSLEEVLDEAEKIRAMGFGHLLLVAGTCPAKVNIEYLTAVVSGLGKKFASIVLEIFSLSTEQYRRLHLAGADGVTLYQETYHKPTYDRVHPSGVKRDFNWRLDTPDRACAAGIRKMNIGFLLGLSDWRHDALALARHSVHLMRHYWQTLLSVSFPRITDHPEDFHFNPVSDRELVQMVTAFRICFPDMNLVISTRERAELRMNLVRMGVTQMSAGSKTTTGGYNRPAEPKDGQFLVNDSRPPEEVAMDLRRMGYEPVWKDWENGLL